jgi:hypothetical protein
MKQLIRMLGIVMATVALTAAGTLPASAQEKTVRAKIGILVKSGDQILKAKSRDRVKAGDLLRIYVHPEASSYVYVVHSDLKTVTLLNMVEQKIQSSTMVLPSVQEFFQVDGKSAVETFTVICSPEEVKAVSALVSSQMTIERWDNLQRELAKKGENELVDKSERPFAIAGTVRGAGDAAGGDPFVKELQIFSGKSVLVKQYEFTVKK